MNSGGVLNKIRKWIIRLAWVPLLFGVAGYHFVGDIEHGVMGFWEAVYATIALYFMNPDSDISNIYVLTAKYTSFLVVADVMFAVFEAMQNSLKHLMSNRFADSTAVYTDNEDWGRTISDYWKHSYLGESDRHPDKLERAKNHIIMFEDDMKNLEIYNRCRKYLEKKHTYIMLNNTDPFLVKELDNQYLHYFNIYELIARKYWKDNDLYDVMTDGSGQVVKIAITDFGKAGEALFRYGYINNVYMSVSVVHKGRSVGVEGVELLRDRPDALRLYDAKIEEQTVVFEVVSNDDAALLLPRQHILHIILNVAIGLNESSINVAGYEIDDVEAVL